MNEIPGKDRKKYMKHGSKIEHLLEKENTYTQQYFSHVHPINLDFYTPVNSTFI